MRKIVYAVSQDYERRTGGWIYNERLIAGLDHAGHRVERLILPDGFPSPTDDAVRKTAVLLATIPDGTLVLLDQICLGVLPALAIRHKHRLSFVMICHHPMSYEAEADKTVVGRLFETERAVLENVMCVIVTSRTTGQTLVDRYGVPGEKLVCAQPGTTRQAIAPGGDGTQPSLLSLGAVIPRKGHDLLVEAMAGLAHLPWTLTIIGNTSRNPEHVARVEHIVVANGLKGRVTLTGELSDADVDACWAKADFFVAASRHEGYGMAIAEALARGMPVITTWAGAVGDWISRDAALVVPTGDVAGLSEAVGSLLTDRKLCRKLRDGAIAQRAALPGWAETARIVSQALERDRN